MARSHALCQASVTDCGTTTRTRSGRQTVWTACPPAIGGLVSATRRSSRVIFLFAATFGAIVAHCNRRERRIFFAVIFHGAKSPLPTKAARTSVRRQRPRANHSHGVIFRMTRFALYSRSSLLALPIVAVIALATLRRAGTARRSATLRRFFPFLFVLRDYRVHYIARRFRGCVVL